MAEWNPITGFMGKWVSVVACILCLGIAAFAGYGWYATKLNGMGLFFAVCLFLALTFLAQILDKARFDRGVRPYFMGFILSSGCIVFGSLFALSIDDYLLSRFVISQGIAGAIVILLSMLIWLRATPIHWSNWNATTFATLLLQLSLIQAAWQYDREGHVGDFFYLTVPIYCVGAIAVFFLFRWIYRKHETRNDLARNPA